MCAVFAATLYGSGGYWRTVNQIADDLLCMCASENGAMPYHLVSGKGDVSLETGKIEMRQTHLEHILTIRYSSE